MKNITLIFLLALLTSCHYKLSKPLHLKYKNDDVLVNVTIKETDYKKQTYFGKIKIANLSHRQIILSANESKISLNSKNALKNGQKPVYKLIAVKNIELHGEPGEIIEQKIFFKANKSLDLENLKIAIEDDLVNGPALLSETVD